MTDMKCTGMEPMVQDFASLPFELLDDMDIESAMEFLDGPDFTDIMDSLSNSTATTVTTPASGRYNNEQVSSINSACVNSTASYSPCNSKDSNNCNSGPFLSPTMDSFLNDTWDSIILNSTPKSLDELDQLRRSDNPSGPAPVTPVSFNNTYGIKVEPDTQKAMISARAPVNTRPHFSTATMLPQPLSYQRISIVPYSIPIPAKSSVDGTEKKITRRAKQCIAEGCTRRAQSNSRCKTHGGGARCQFQGCDKSSQGGGLCRAHGGGKKCRVQGCTKGTQRQGLCYLHGGIRRCLAEGCTKKDRGNGFCISHGGGRRCHVRGCTRSVRKGNRCQTHQIDNSTNTINKI